jgi:hypothetical protein
LLRKLNKEIGRNRVLRTGGHYELRPPEYVGAEFCSGIAWISKKNRVQFVESERARSQAVWEQQRSVTALAGQQVSKPQPASLQRSGRP